MAHSANGNVYTKTPRNGVQCTSNEMRLTRLAEPCHRSRKQPLKERSNNSSRKHTTHKLHSEAAAQSSLPLPARVNYQLKTTSKRLFVLAVFCLCSFFSGSELTHFHRILLDSRLTLDQMPIPAANEKMAPLFQPSLCISACRDPAGEPARPHSQPANVHNLSPSPVIAALPAQSTRVIGSAKRAFLCIWLHCPVFGWRSTAALSAGDHA